MAIAHMVILQGYTDEDSFAKMYSNRDDASEAYEALLQGFDEDKHIYLEWTGTDDTLYRPKAKTIKYHGIE